MTRAEKGRGDRNMGLWDRDMVLGIVGQRTKKVIKDRGKKRGI
jgi:hypothetical protein